MTPTDRRVQMMVGRGTVAKVDDAHQLQELQVEMLEDETHDEIERFTEYGFTSHPKEGAEHVMVAVGGLRSHGIVIAVADRRYRLQGLSQGEVALHDDQDQVIHLTRDGIVIRSSKGVSIDATGADVAIVCDNFTVTASAKIKLAGDDIEVGNGATLAAARRTDTVASGAINSGSSKVKVA
ncbi:phage baseplate assembly protein V [Sphingomonas sp. AR_OL41]|uniref:phage baseplate assembly protein V n=1 Tax=Sphingomonas sp. AR_OL41 TaxID=3042729 RepID=UPI002480F078|nr:phage baseplate assembly protein V [Sphingomonas sp. AR_OL41]MDH7971790.1 phage baseplate assembly protein V [Sphingomonas sp. AR_OL41]